MNGKLDSNLLGNFGIDGPGGSNIKSIQRGTATIPLSNTSTTVTIGAVDPTKSIVLVDFGNNGLWPITLDIYAELTNSTTINLTRYNSGDYTQTINWVVIEFNNVKSKQTGLQSLSNSTEVTVNIANVDMSKALIFASYNSSQSMDPEYLKTRFISSTQIGLTQIVSSIMKVAWQVIEFN
jgi:hypothetical protein